MRWETVSSNTSLAMPNNSLLTCCTRAAAASGQDDSTNVNVDIADKGHRSIPKEVEDIQILNLGQKMFNSVSLLIMTPTVWGSSEETITDLGYVRPDQATDIK